MTRRKVTYITVSEDAKTDLEPILRDFTRLALDAFWQGLSSEAKREIFRTIPKRPRTRAKYRMLMREWKAWEKAGHNQESFLVAQNISLSTFQRAFNYVWWTCIEA